MVRAETTVPRAQGSFSTRPSIWQDNSEWPVASVDMGPHLSLFRVDLDQAGWGWGTLTHQGLGSNRGTDLPHT